MGRVDKGINCSATGCKDSAERSISKSQISQGVLNFSSEGRRIYLCKSHYKQWKKSSRDSRDLERTRYG